MEKRSQSGDLIDVVVPTTHCLMEDPVNAADGETYERAAIERWFSNGNVSSPMTGERVETTKVFPNKSKWRRIVAWKDTQRNTTSTPDQF